ncbi:MAG: COX15/CtaA family protein [Bdellovibrionales bacterium]|nr:COX15/CtaA family protein [Bdellovibrionales bacterium]
MRSNKLFSHLLLGLLAYSLIVFLWGAWVRISGSGDGCGEHWPFCQGQLIPDSYILKVWIENFHRISTKLYGFIVIALLISVYRQFPKKSPTRKWMTWVFGLTLVEGLIGAVIVLKGFVADDDSIGRAFLISIHLVNTFLLTSTIIFTWLSQKYKCDIFLMKFFKLSRSYILIGFILCIGATGALAALSTTLFPSVSLFSGLTHDFSKGSHFLLKIRILHPLLAIGFLFLAGYKTQSLIESSQNSIHKYWGRIFQVLLLVTFFIGAITLGLLSPLSLKLIHLFFAHLLWMSFVMFLSTRFIPESSLKK